MVSVRPFEAQFLFVFQSKVEFSCRGLPRMFVNSEHPEKETGVTVTYKP